MKAIADEGLDSTDVLQFVGPDLLENGSGGVRPRVLLGPHKSPVLRGAAYIAALNGEPWRPHV